MYYRIAEKKPGGIREIELCHSIRNEGPGFKLASRIMNSRNVSEVLKSRWIETYLAMRAQPGAVPRSNTEGMTPLSKRGLSETLTKEAVGRVDDLRKSQELKARNSLTRHHHLLAPLLVRFLVQTPTSDCKAVVSQIPASCLANLSKNHKNHGMRLASPSSRIFACLEFACQGLSPCIQRAGDHRMPRTWSPPNVSQPPVSRSCSLEAPPQDLSGMRKLEATSAAHAGSRCPRSRRIGRWTVVEEYRVVVRKKTPRAEKPLFHSTSGTLAADSASARQSAPGLASSVALAANSPLSLCNQNGRMHKGHCLAPPDVPTVLLPASASGSDDPNLPSRSAPIAGPSSGRPSKATTRRLTRREFHGPSIAANQYTSNLSSIPSYQPFGALFARMPRQCGLKEVPLGVFCFDAPANTCPQRHIRRGREDAGGALCNSPSRTSGGVWEKDAPMWVEDASVTYIDSSLTDKMSLSRFGSTIQLFSS
ncbi:hypothetical protein B0H15DRAFT_932565 [Mycena belliarum]|uniref:Uncharacterized protein n=1 Tax=Mycena belliarum TaxID=1033014 RepID=A0AAD6XNW8_9AGAR|nr:hypothetical protein B0H15DRAFT_932565 [Mycena belliae]